MSEPTRKSTQLGLSFPYDWSNPNIGDEALILNVLERGIYTDICRICSFYGIAHVEQLCNHLPEPLQHSSSLKRMLNNIKIGFAHAETQQLRCEPQNGIVSFATFFSTF